MRKEYGKVLRTLFSKEMEKSLRHFEETKVDSVYFWPGDRAFRWKFSDDLHCWIVLSPSQKGYDEFTVLIGWSKMGRYPELSMVPCFQMPTSERTEFDNDEYLTRLPSLWTHEDRWWVVREFSPAISAAELEARMKPIPADEARQTVMPLVKDAIDKLQRYGVPYLETFCQTIG